MYCERIETTLRNANALLSKELEETRLDLADSTKSRRDLQKQIEYCQYEYTRVSSEHKAFIVSFFLVTLSSPPMLFSLILPTLGS